MPAMSLVQHLILNKSADMLPVRNPARVPFVNQHDMTLCILAPCLICDPIHTYTIC